MARWEYRIIDYWRRAIGLGLFAAVVSSAAQTVAGLHEHLFYVSTFSFALGFWLLAVLVHELGHIAAALAAGWQVHLVSFLSIHYLPRARRLGDAPRVGKPDFGGYVFATAATPEGVGKGNFLFDAGGIAANLVAALGVLALARWWFLGQDAAIVLTGFGWVCLSVGIANALPYVEIEPERFENDGTRLLFAFLDRGKGGHSGFGIWLYGQFLDGVPPRSWVSSVVASLDFDSSLAVPLKRMLQLRYRMATGDMEKALSLFHKYGSGPDVLLPQCAAEYAYLIALVERDAGKAEAVLAMMPKDARRSYLFWRAKAAAEALKGEHNNAKFSVSVAKSRRDAAPDKFDDAVFEAIEAGRDIPVTFSAAPA